MFTLIYSDEARKELKKLPVKVSSHILTVLERCRVRPHSFAKKLVSSPYFRIRAGKYRIIVDIQNKNLIVFVIDIGNRKNIYK